MPKNLCSQADGTGPVHSDLVQRSNERAECVIRCCSVLHKHQLKELPGDCQSLINTPNKYGQLSNICYISALINCNRKSNKLLDFVIHLAAQVS